MHSRLYSEFSLLEMYVWIIAQLIFLVTFGWMRYFSPLGTSATLWPIVLAQDNAWWRVWFSRWNDWQGKQKLSEKTWSRVNLSTTNHTWFQRGSNPGRRGGKPATDRLIYGTAISHLLVRTIILHERLFQPVLSSQGNTRNSTDTEWLIQKQGLGITVGTHKYQSKILYVFLTWTTSVV
jgi:hypothetical protein